MEFLATLIVGWIIYEGLALTVFGVCYLGGTIVQNIGKYYFAYGKFEEEKVDRSNLRYVLKLVTR